MAVLYRQYLFFVKNFLLSFKISHSMEKLLGKSLFNQIMKRSFYGHFVAGENQEEINVKIIKSFHSFKYSIY